MWRLLGANGWVRDYWASDEVQNVNNVGAVNAQMQFMCLSTILPFSRSRYRALFIELEMVDIGLSAL